MMKPKKGQRRRISSMPTTKATVPFHFWRRAKKRAVFWKPIIRVRPIMKRIWVWLGISEEGEVEVVRFP
jgi:hypothetical protein